MKRFEAVIKIPNPIWKEVYVEAKTKKEAILAIKAEFCDTSSSNCNVDFSGDLYWDPRDNSTEDGYQTHKTQIIEIKERI
tara:strand:- start:335 stop:574 length:240 start_codon:yes stop_codon:yes gene_type:complete